MGNRLSKIYTRTGDDGTTGLGDGSRVPKENLRVEAYGTVDEANSAIGMVLSVAALPPPIARCLTEVQHDLFDLGGELCIPGHRMIDATHVERLETELDGFNENLPPLKEFILPGGGPAAAACHVRRSGPGRHVPFMGTELYISRCERSMLQVSKMAIYSDLEGKNAPHGPAKRP